MPDKIIEDVYGNLKKRRWGIGVIVAAAAMVVLFAIWNSFPDSVKERILGGNKGKNPSGAEGTRTSGPGVPVTTPDPADCILKVDSFSFEPGSPYLSGMTRIRMDMIGRDVVEIFNQCGINYFIEVDSPTIHRIEVTPSAGMVRRVTYYTFNNRINTIGFSIVQGTHQALRDAARKAFGPPRNQRQHRGFNYDEWIVGGMKLSLFEEGGSFFRE